MTVRTSFQKRQPIRWQQIDPSIAAAIDAAVASWVETPYMPGQRAKGIGTDCVQQVAGILDDLFKSQEPTDLPRIAPDSAIHDTRQAWPVIKGLRTAHYGSRVIRSGTIEPGDVIVTRATSLPGAPRRQAHLLFACSTPFTALHAIQGVGSHITTLEVTNGILRIYRPRRKDLWRSP